jgi:hypothetical protein
VIIPALVSGTFRLRFNSEKFLLRLIAFFSRFKGAPARFSESARRLLRQLPGKAAHYPARFLQLFLQPVSDPILLDIR